MQIMIVDDERIIRESFFHWFQKSGHTVETAASGAEALDKLTQAPFDLLFVDIKMPGMDGIELLAAVKERYPETLVVIITAYGSIESAVNAMKIGATDYLVKPFKPDQLSLVMEKVAQHQKRSSEYNYLKGRLEKITRFDNIIGQSAAMTAVFEMIAEVADSDASVLLAGETGTGKELIARAIHAKSPRANLPFIAINCGAIPDTLLESELFGHQKGAYTGATHDRKGFLEVVGGGTLFLDEVGEISPKMQVDLLRVLEDKTVTRVGSRRPVSVDFRLVTATSRDLDAQIDAGHFREDFYYRINVIQIDIPPLRQRKADIQLLADHFLKKLCHETTKRVDRISPRALQLLEAYDWPGNVRELENAIERAMVLSKSRMLDEADFAFLQPPGKAAAHGPALRDMEKHHILDILDQYGWNITQAAKALGINRVTLHKKIRRYQLKAGSRDNQ
ncbi:sigma-54-dependent transcriptional regulator [Desulfosarcina ovata]|uniref:DNA-binding response regulator n=2 Tax=Desulfosarcina ovata TaxID=83564 RepID=A0A5K8A9Y8_9BACT|nr:sigma-54 dependent transcriptional regulator [Desulfosarcina ovata]BBO82185.1 DNA-binding response regulator [Desulfosarcina ovata subsp. sediminis]BBO89395.1 DNA-binding response regulator [Desulfosarcina ovata subsp. ovata]